MDYDRSIRLDSPSGVTSATVGLRDGRPAYEVAYGGAGVVAPSPLGLTLESGSLRDGFAVAGTDRRTVDETWEPAWGRYDEIREHYRELRVELERPGDGPTRLDLVVRAFDDGVGFRYELPGTGGLDGFVVTGEATGFDLAGEYDAWWIPGDYDSYEYRYDRDPAGEVGRAHTPLTVRAGPDRYLSVHEAALRDYAAMTLSGPAAGAGEERVRSPEGVPFTATLTPLPDGAKVRAATPHRSPWRTVRLGRDPGDLVESSLVVNLNEPPAFDADWVAPDTYVGIWWEMHVGKSTWSPGPRLGATTANAKRYVDFAADHDVGTLLVEGWNDGWEGGWDGQDFTTPNPQYDPEAVAEYAAERGVDLVAHCETGGDFLDFEDQLAEAFAMYERLGMSAVKTGYVTDIDEGGMPGGHHHHDQRLVNHHHRVARAAADHGLMLDAHEGVKPTGLRRTYPNFVTRECVRGMEYNAWSEGNPPRHTVVLPFTRMLAGPLDYTPGIFDVRFPAYGGEEAGAGHDYDGETRVHTTRARQLALMVVLFSGLQMAADLPGNYEGEPEFAFVSAVPADWDDTRVLNAAIGEYVTVARRSGEEWFVASATDATPRDLEVPLSFLDEGTYEARVYRDADDCDLEENPEAVAVETRTVTREDVLVASMVGGGGHAVHLVPA